MTNEEIINELLTLKANAEEVSNRCDRLIKKLGPSTTRKKDALTDEQIARIRAKGRKTRLKQLQK